MARAVSALYNVFDAFITGDTWHASDRFDEERFYKGPAKVIADPAFSPDAMGPFMRLKNGIADDHEYRISDVINR